MRKLILLTIAAFLICPLSLSAQNRFSLSLDTDSATGDQAVTSVNISPDQVVSIQVFGANIQNANGLATRFEYDATQVVYEGFDAGSVLPDARELSTQGANPTFVEINLTSFGNKAAVNTGLLGTVRFRTMTGFSGTSIRLVRADLAHGGQFERVTLNVRVELQSGSAALTPDFDGDGVVGFTDFVLFASLFDAHQGDGRYEARYDLDGNGEIGFGDFVIFGNNFGKRVSSPESPPTPPPIESVTMPRVRLLRLAQNYRDVEYLVYSPDGTRIAFISERGDNDAIYIMNADGTNPIRLTQNYYDVEYLAYSPDGTQIAFISERGDNDAIYVINADGTNPIRLTQNYYDVEYLAYSPDGTRIAFVSERGDNDAIYVMNADGSNPIRLTQNYREVEYIAYSPDGTRIAFVSERGDNDAIYVMNADGTNPIRLTQNYREVEYIAYSPDGTRIAFVSERGDNDAIYVMNADGSNPIRLTQNYREVEYLVWSPDGSEIIIFSDRYDDRYDDDERDDDDDDDDRDDDDD